MSQVKRQKADVVPLELVRTLSVVGGCRMNPEIEVKALYESRGVLRGIQHFTASPTASNTLIIFVILIEDNSEFGFLRKYLLKELGECSAFLKSGCFVRKQLWQETESSILYCCPCSSQEATFSLLSVRLPASVCPAHPRAVLKHCTVQGLRL